MGDNTDTTTSSTGSSSPVIRATLDKLFGGLGKAYDAGAPPAFNSSLYSPAGATTRAGWSSALTAANNPAYSSGVNTATRYENGLLKSGGLASGQGGDINNVEGLIRQYGQLGDNGGLTPAQAAAMGGETALGGQYGALAGAYQGDLPGYANLREKAGNDALTSVNGVFNNSGRFGGGSNAKAAGEGVTSALSGLDYANYTNDINNRYRSLDSQRGVLGDTFNMGQTGVGNTFNALQGEGNAAGTAFGMRQQGVNNVRTGEAALPQLFQSSLLPSATLSAVGAAKDANAQGILQGKYDLFNRQNNNKLDWLSKLSGIITGGAGAGGTTTTSTSPSTPLWQSLLGLGIGGLGALA